VTVSPLRDPARSGWLRRAAWLAGSPARWTLIGLILLYRATLSGMLGGQCRFDPSCSVYAEEAVRLRGAIRGIGLAVWRIARCGPFARGGPDPAPGRGPTYDSVVLGEGARRGR
jgi:putative membrane protein insertion efficiency factor